MLKRIVRLICPDNDKLRRDHLAVTLVIPCMAAALYFIPFPLSLFCIVLGLVFGATLGFVLVRFQNSQWLRYFAGICALPVIPLYMLTYWLMGKRYSYRWLDYEVRSLDYGLQGL